MKKVKTAAFQGDVMFLRVDALPEEAKRSKSDVVAHSETGHHHVVEGKDFGLYVVSQMRNYLKLGTPANIVHKRPHDTHETLRLSPGIWEVRRQREWAPEGWRRVED